MSKKMHQYILKNFVTQETTFFKDLDSLTIFVNNLAPAHITSCLCYELGREIKISVKIEVDT